MAIEKRLRQLEREMVALLRRNETSGQKTLVEEMQDLFSDAETVRAWLKERGYGNALEAVAAEQTGPKLLTVGWSLARYSEIERDTVEEKICAHFNPDVSLWYHRGRGWCTPIKGRLEYLAENCEEAVKRFRQLTAET